VHSPATPPPPNPCFPPPSTVKRSKQLQHGRLGDLVLQPKDVLVLSTAPDFNPGSSDFTANFDK
jgi:hypothetical protein